jgi:hypothetical protein
MPRPYKYGTIIAPPNPRSITIDNRKSFIAQNVERPWFYVFIREKPSRASTSGLTYKRIQLRRSERYFGKQQGFMECGQALLAFPRSWCGCLPMVGRAKVRAGGTIFQNTVMRQTHVGAI